MLLVAGFPAPSAVLSVPHILLVTDAAFYPPFQGDSARLFRMIQYFLAHDWTVSVIHFHDCDQRDVNYIEMSRLADQLIVYFPSRQDLRRRSSDRLDNWCPDQFGSLVGSVCRSSQVDVVVAQFVFFSKCLLF